MATKDTRSSNRFSEARAGEQSRMEDAAHIGGMAAAFSRAFAMGPQVLALQRALLAGMVQSQQREAERLAVRHGMDDERVGEALERATRFEQLGAAAGSGGDIATRLAQTFQQDGLFHGYVADAGGTSAVGHTVRLQVQSQPGAKGAFHGSAKTDSDGYFRIELNTHGRPARTDADALTRWLQSLTDEDPGEARATQVDDGGAATQPGQTGPTSSVQVLAPTGRVVFEDPDPPTFDTLSSEFRYYVLTDSDADRKARRSEA